MNTLEEAKEFLKQNWEYGTTCPCCNQHVKLYRRKLNSAMAYGLIILTQNRNNVDTSDWFHLENYLKPIEVASTLRGDMPKLRHWGLIEAKKARRDDGDKRNGYYRVTQRGRDFVEGKLSVQQKVKLYNKDFYGYEGDYITIKDALGSHFNYSELMDHKMKQPLLFDLDKPKGLYA